MKIINLLPKEQQHELKLDQISGQVRRFWTWIILTLLALVLVGFGSSLYLTQRISANKNDIENKKQVLNNASTKQLEQEVSALNKQINLIDSLRANHYHWSKVLVELSYLVDTDTKLTSIQMDRETGKVQVFAEAADRESVLSFWAAVKKTDMFKNIDFPLTNLEKDVEAPFNFIFFVDAEELKKE